MFARTVTFAAAKDIDAGIEFTRTKVVPLLREQHGFAGAFGSADRSNGVFGVLTLWQSEADRDASESALAKTRGDAQEVIGGEMTIEHYEESIVEMEKPPGVGARLVLRRVSMDPSRVDENLAFFKTHVLPEIKGLDGFVAVRNMINRDTGEGMVGTLWSDDAGAQAAAAHGEANRDRAAGQGVKFGEQSIRELVLAELP